MTITRRSDEEVRLRAELARIYELFQDLIAAIGADQETGTHHGNNVSAVAWAKANPHTIRAIGVLLLTLDVWSPQ